jgi:Mg-chelatase subunit ChlD
MRYLNCANSITPSAKPEFLMTLVDLSPSMDEDDWKPTRLAGAIKANRQLIEAKTKLHPKDMLGIIGFYGKAITLHPPIRLDSGAHSLINALQSPTSGGSTNFTAALTLAERCLFANVKPRNNKCHKTISKMIKNFLYESPNSSSIVANNYTYKADCLRRIIMLSDGEHNCGGSPKSVASRLKNAGVIIDCIGIGGSPEDVDEELLKEIASNNPDGSVRYCFIGDQTQLLRKYKTLASHIRPV